MLLRDLLVALPGLVGTVGTPSRAQDIEVKSSQIVSPTASSIPETIASSVRIPTA